ncbi:MAG: hypothetical protein ACXVI0_10035 [Halobacteriota archaeon]
MVKETRRMFWLEAINITGALCGIASLMLALSVGGTLNGIASSVLNLMVTHF